MMPRFKVVVNKAGKYVEEEAILDPNDVRYGSSGGTFPTRPMDISEVQCELDCPGPLEKGFFGATKGRQGSHREKIEISFDVTGKEPKSSRKFKGECGVAQSYKAFLEQKREPPHIFHYHGYVPSGAGFTNEKVKLVVSPPRGLSPQESTSS